MRKIARPVSSIVEVLGRLSGRWLEKGYSYRKRAFRRLTEKSRFPSGTADALLDRLFSQLTVPRLTSLLKAEFRDPLVLDGFRHDPLTGAAHRAEGPRLITHIFSANVPNPSVISFVLGMLVKSRNIGKLSGRDRGFLDIYLESLKKADAPLGRMNSLLGSGDQTSFSKALEESDLVVAYGDDKTLEAIRSRVPAKTRFCGYGHRVSFSVYLKEVLTRANFRALAAKTARDIRALDQRGCLSPSAIYLEKGGEVPAVQFCREIARSLSGKGGRWQVLCNEEIGTFPLHPEAHLVYVKAFEKCQELYQGLRPVSRYLQSAALEAGARRRKEIAFRLSELGVNRVCRAGRMQDPPLTWHHDGMPNLASWVRWTDLEA